VPFFDGVVGRGARLGLVQAGELQSFPDLLPAAVGHPRWW
jgi:hypothetical protein